VLLAWVAIGPDPVRAACAHRAQPRLSEEAAALEPFGDAPTPIEAPRPAGRPRPCTGAMCSGQPAPPASSTAPAPVRVSAWAILVPPAPATAPGSSALPRDERDVRAIEPAGSVFHPPRLALP
jgi:hypothetical protein